MENYEIWSLAINATAAAGTIAAVWVALWLSLKKNEYLIVHNIEARGISKIGDNAILEIDESYITMLIENKLPVPMKIHPLRIEFERAYDGSKQIAMLEAKVDMLPAHSRYNIKFPMTKQFDYGEISNNTGITYKLETSGGDIRDMFPKDWEHILYMGLEHDHEEEGPTSE